MHTKTRIAEWSPLDQVGLLQSDILYRPKLPGHNLLITLRSNQGFLFNFVHGLGRGSSPRVRGKYLAKRAKSRGYFPVFLSITDWNELPIDKKFIQNFLHSQGVTFHSYCPLLKRITHWQENHPEFLTLCVTISSRVHVYKGLRQAKVSVGRKDWTIWVDKPLTQDENRQALNAILSLRTCCNMGLGAHTCSMITSSEV